MKAQDMKQGIGNPNESWGMAEHADADESRSDQSNFGDAQTKADPVCDSFLPKTT
jgi:hypothetical protein